MILASIYSVHMDKEHWGDPENFRPERFISKDGKLIQDDWFIPFALGKIFLFLITVISFNI